MPEWIAELTLGNLATVAAIVGGFAVLIKRLTPLMLVMTDITGTPARPGFERRPGLLERMQLMEAAQRGMIAAQTEMSAQIAELAADLHAYTSSKERTDP